MATLWVSREAVNGDPVHETFEAARQAFIVSLARKFGLKAERKEDCLGEGLVDYGLHGSAGQVAAFLKRLADYKLGGFTVDVDENDPRGVEILEKANRELAQKLTVEICQI